MNTQRSVHHRVGILYQPKIEASVALAERLGTYFSEHGTESWRCSAWDEEEARAGMAGTTLAISLGGDGTILRVARIIVPYAVPILAVNLGKLGFLSEVSPDEVLGRLPAVLGGQGWTEERLMLQVELIRRVPGRPGDGHPPSPLVYHALNDVVVGRGILARVIQVDTRVDGALLTTYRADGLIVATPTGSTSYSLAAGGPIIHPQAEVIALTPIAPHLTLDRPLLVPAGSRIELEVHTDHQAGLSLDGQIELRVEDGDRVGIVRSPYATRFLRMRPPGYFVGTLVFRLCPRGGQ